jgi:hypothetical protein
MDKKDSSRPQYVDPAHLDLAKALQASGACPPNLSRLLFLVKMARDRDSPSYISELHERARVMAAISDSTAEPDYFQLLASDVPKGGQAPVAPSPKPRRDAIAALSAGVKEMRLQDSAVEDDDVSAVTASTFDFGAAFSGGAQQATVSSQAGSDEPKPLSKTAAKKARKAAAQAKLSGQSDLPQGSVSEGAPGSAEADPWAGL